MRNEFWVTSGAALAVLFTSVLAGAEGRDSVDERLETVFVGELNPEMSVVVNAMKRLAPKALETLSVSQARRQPTLSDGALTVLQEAGTANPDKLPAVSKIESKSIPASDGHKIPVRIYTPKGRGLLPVIIYFKGGGWVTGSLDNYDGSARALASMTRAIVVSVDYRQAPEYKFPAAHEDAYAVLQYVIQNAQFIAGDGERVAVVGEGSGGNLATAICLMARERGGRMPVHEVLIYPITDYRFDTSGYTRNRDARPFSAATINWFFDNYLNSAKDGESTLISPLRASLAELSKLPPTTIVTAEVDPLQRDGQEYGDKLKEAGVDVEVGSYSGVTHDFFGLGLFVDAAKDAEQFVSDRLVETFRVIKN